MVGLAGVLSSQQKGGRSAQGGDVGWPAQHFDRPLAVGAVGGHGPIRYEVAEYEPGRRIRFRFRGPRGFHRYHEYEAFPWGLRHTLKLEPRGWARLTWPVVYRPLHDALIEDSLHAAAVNLGAGDGERPRWSAWVRVLRFVVRRIPYG